MRSAREPRRLVTRLLNVEVEISRRAFGVAHLDAQPGASNVHDPGAREDRPELRGDGQRHRVVAAELWLERRRFGSCIVDHEAGSARVQGVTRAALNGP